MAKATKKQVLGRGLTSILEDSKNKASSISKLKTKYSTEIEISKITLNPFQPRSAFNKEKLEELINSIKNIGLIQPITIKKLSKNKFQLISGERRLRAFKQLKINKIPCYIRKANDQESLEMALVENIHRQDLDAIEIAISYKRLIEEIKLTQDELSDKIGKKRSTVSNYLRLLKLNPIVQSGIKDGFISMGHGRAMINIGSKTIYDLLENECSSDDCIHKSNLEYLDVIPAHIDLVGIEIESIDMIEREYLLRNTIFDFKADYDFIIIDCPPSLGLLTINALTAADSVLIPIQCEYLALEGLGKLLNTIKSIQKLHNKDLSIEGLLLTMYDTRLNLSNQVKKEVKLHFNEMVFKTVIHRNVRLGEATSYGKSIIDYDVSSKGADNYLNLAKEIISKN